MQTARYGFRIIGSTRGSRRLVDADAAFSGYADCDDRAEVNKEAYLSAFQFGDEFRRHLEMTGSTKGYSGECWSPWLWWDIDREGDIENATHDTRCLVIYLVERYGLDGDELLIFFSGGKGYHVGLPTSLWRPEPSGMFHQIARRFAVSIAELASIDVDTSVYDRVRAFRAPNSRHPKTGLNKRLLRFDELMYVQASAIVERASSPLPFELPDPPTPNEQSTADWRKAAEQASKTTKANKHRRLNGEPKLNRRTIEFIRDGAPTGQRHLTLFSAAANLAEFDCPPALANALLSESALDCGLSPSDVRRQIECGLASVQESP